MRPLHAQPIIFFSLTDLRKVIDLPKLKAKYYEEKIAVAELWRYLVPARQELMQLYHSRFNRRGNKENDERNISNARLIIIHRQIAVIERKHNDRIAQGEKYQSQFNRNWNDNLMSRIAKYCRYKVTY